MVAKIIFLGNGDVLDKFIYRLPNYDEEEKQAIDTLKAFETLSGSMCWKSF